ncbi:putative DNA-binding domain-containing protein [Synechococcus sp. ATX 2A4]|uniref:HvfC/BufC N-terminal domain-containing protein n=1 Tax=Synechococcus sp. ATX 2A4 TaxID=2823727 RepID=UPI0020CBB39A|nr:DNA-binding domain-containing protein [Synechococcus sp. ATX 2A4]MCP9884643.1 putative DNA-binding domain-containing protein [Synechococcus sp. ATX 2A4]
MEIDPVCERLVGEPFFAAMAGRYATEHASTSPDLGDYGGELPAFLRAFTPMAPGVQCPR